MRVLPQEGVTHMAALGHTASFEELEAKVVAWLRHQEAIGIVRSKGPVQMDLSAVGAPGQAAPQAAPQNPGQANWGSLQKQIAELSALVKGGGKGGYSTGGKGGWSNWQGHAFF